MNNELFKAKVEKLEESITKRDELSAKIKKEKDEFEKTQATDKVVLDSYKTEIEVLKGIVGDMAVDEFNITKEKKFFGGIGIQEKKTMSYPTDAAFKYAKEKDMFILFDEKSFNKVATTLSKSGQLPFQVKTGTTPAATFPKVIKLEDK